MAQYQQYMMSFYNQAQAGQPNAAAGQPPAQPAYEQQYGSGSQGGGGGGPQPPQDQYSQYYNQQYSQQPPRPADGGQGQMGGSGPKPLFGGGNWIKVPLP